MSYDIRLLDPQTHKTVLFEKPHEIIIGEYPLGGSCEAWLNLPENYDPILKRVLGDKGIYSIDKMTADEAKKILINAISKLGEKVSPDANKPCDGDTKLALYKIIQLALKNPDAVFEIYNGEGYSENDKNILLEVA